jgi:hypothetical protein
MNNTPPTFAQIPGALKSHRPWDEWISNKSLPNVLSRDGVEGKPVDDCNVSKKRELATKRLEKSTTVHRQVRNGTELRPLMRRAAAMQLELRRWFGEQVTQLKKGVEIIGVDLNTA